MPSVCDTAKVALEEVLSPSLPSMALSKSYGDMAPVSQSERLAYDYELSSEITANPVDKKLSKCFQ